MTKAQLVDIGERVVWTAVQAFIASLIASFTISGLGIDWQEALGIAGIAALASAAKNLAGIQLGNTNSPQAMPGGTYTYSNGA